MNVKGIRFYGLKRCGIMGLHILTNTTFAIQVWEKEFDKFSKRLYLPNRLYQRNSF